MGRGMDGKARPGTWIQWMAGYGCHTTGMCQFTLALWYGSHIKVTTPLCTPQEISPHSKSYVVGPASLVAVKTGQSLPFDTNFVIAEVNADILDYCEVEKDKFELAIADTKRV